MRHATERVPSGTELEPGRIAPEPRRFAVARRQRHIFAEGLGFALAAERQMQFLRRAARVFAGGDPDLAEDMVQEALIELWDRDFSRFDASDDRELRKVLMERMRFVKAREKLQWGSEWRVEDDPDELEAKASAREGMEPSEAMRAALDEEEE
jgi:DNA-directed RNA polymerase specialized sigma24 family protein